MFCLAYLADIFAASNNFGISLQGRGSDIISSVDKITAFKWKLDLWLKRVLKGSFNLFPKFIDLRKNRQVDKHVLSNIEEHLTLLRSKFDYIFRAKRLSRHGLKIHYWPILVVCRKTPKKNS